MRVRPKMVIGIASRKACIRELPTTARISFFCASTYKLLVTANSASACNSLLTLLYCSEGPDHPVSLLGEEQAVCPQLHCLVMVSNGTNQVAFVGVQQALQSHLCNADKVLHIIHACHHQQLSGSLHPCLLA